MGTVIVRTQAGCIAAGRASRVSWWSFTSVVVAGIVIVRTQAGCIAAGRASRVSW